MTADDFGKIALSFPGAEERAHMSHPDFRANGRIFATLGYPDEHHGMVRLSPEDQPSFEQAEPEVFSKAKGAWGRHGATIVLLKKVRKSSLRKAMKAAWRNTQAR